MKAAPSDSCSSDRVFRPLVSIGFPVFNGELSMRAALDSVLQQSYDNLEIIISDNASTDKTQDICLEYARKDTRIRYHRNAANIGLTGNLRRVIELSSGDYFMWACADDIRPANAVEACVNALQQAENLGAVLAHGPILFSIPGQNHLIEVANPLELGDSSPRKRIHLFTRNIRHLCIVYGLHRTAALKRAFFPESLGQEYLLCLQMLLQGSWVRIAAPMVVYRLRKTQINLNPLYDEIPLTLRHLLTAGPIQRRKCWTVLCLGCYYLLKLGNVSIFDRLKAAGTHLVHFVFLYKRQLFKELAFQIFFPLCWLACRLLKTAKTSPNTIRLLRRFKPFTKSAAVLGQRNPEL